MLTTSRVLAAATAVCALMLTACADDKPSPASTATTQPVASLPSTSSDAVVGPTAPVVFNGVTVSGGSNLAAKPMVTSKGSGDPAKIQVKDLVVGAGPAASPQSTVSVQYVGVLYADGKQFDASWDNGGAPAQFSLQGVVPGFTQGIGGTDGVKPMKVGGRRIMILPSALGYGPSGNGPIPPNAPLVFVVDLTQVS